MGTIVVPDKTGESLEQIFSGIEQRHPNLKRIEPAPKTLEQLFGNTRAQEMRRDAAIMARIDRRKLGDDY